MPQNVTATSFLLLALAKLPVPIHREANAPLILAAANIKKFFLK